MAMSVDKGEALYIEMRLTKAANGKSFTVEGVLSREKDEKKYRFNLSGTLTASGKLRAQYFEGTNKNDAKPLDGSWDFLGGTVVLDAIPWSRNERMSFSPDKNRGGEYVSSDWGKVTLHGTLWGCQGSYHMSENDRGTYYMDKNESGSKLIGRWFGQNGHTGTCETSKVGETMSVVWVCTGTCNGKGGTSTWTRKGR